MDELTESRLAEIERRARVATPGPWKWVGRTPVDDVEDGEFPPLTGEDDILVSPSGQRIHSDGSAYGEYGPDIDVRGPDAEFIAHARQDIPLLLDALKVAHEGIAVMMRDSDAYQRGKEDGRRECVEALGELAARQRRAIGPGFATRQTLNLDQRATAPEAAADLLRKEHDLPPPLPPDAARRENERLREALRRITGLVTDTMELSVRDAVSVAREALGESTP